MGKSAFHINGWQSKEHLSLLVTDSGLGGLSICAEIVKHLTSDRQFSTLSVVYFNAWPLQDKGYNYLEDDETRIRIFGNAIGAMNQYAPDLIFIACNTLSVIFQKGGLAAYTRSKVLDIISFGIDMITGELESYPRSTVLLLGTRTTIASGVYKQRLVDRGIAGFRIAQQNCHGLAVAIESDPHSPQVQSLVDQFMEQAASTLPPDAKHIFVALCCTHYGYIRSLIKERLSRYTNAGIDIINPNQAMSEFVMNETLKNRFQTMKLDIKVVSRVHLPLNKIRSISERIEAVCPQTAQALRNYEHIPNLFDVR